MGILRSLFGRKPSPPPEVWVAPAPRAKLGLPPIEISGRVEPGQATPGGYRQAYREDHEIPEAQAGERWAPEWHDDSEEYSEGGESQLEAPSAEPTMVAFAEAEPLLESFDIASQSSIGEQELVEPSPEAEPADMEPGPTSIVPVADFVETPASAFAEANTPPEISSDAEPAIRVTELEPAQAIPEAEPAGIPLVPEATPEVTVTVSPKLEAPAPSIIAAHAAFQRVIAPPPEPDIRAALAEIETLGDSPELGLLRQKLGAGPDGLLGFSTMYPAALIMLLKTRFAGAGGPENLTTKPAWGYHYIVDKRYDFTWKSEIKIGEMDDAAVLAYESSRLMPLRAQLITNLTENRRLFVYAGPALHSEIAQIRAAMRGYGVNTLLHLVIADAGTPAGQVAWRQPGLLHGTLSRYGNKDGRWDIAEKDWVAVCLAAHKLWKSSPSA